MVSTARQADQASGRGARPARPRGFSLIEVLVTMVLLAIGLLGLAGLQARSMANSHSSFYRTIAAQQAYDIADRMAANLLGVDAGNYDNLTATLPANPNCIASGCSVANIALTDHYQWLRANAAVLPGGSGTVANIGGSSCIFEVRVMWHEKGMNDPGSVSSDPNCPTGTAPNTRCFVTRFTP